MRMPFTRVSRLSIWLVGLLLALIPSGLDAGTWGWAYDYDYGTQWYISSFSQSPGKPGTQPVNPGPWYYSYTGELVGSWITMTAYTGPHCLTGEAGIQVNMTSRWQWVPSPQHPNEPPPPESWIHEYLGINWGEGHEETCGDRAVSWHCSVGGYGGQLGPGTFDYTRWRKIDSSSGIVCPSVDVTVVGQVTAPCGEMHSTLVGCEYGITEVSNRPDQSALDIVPSPWDQDSTPYDFTTPNFNPGLHGGLSGGDPVNLATGEHLYLPAPDITVYNPYGPGVIYQRNFIGTRASRDYYSPGLSAGWVDGYDVGIVPFSSEDWDLLLLTYPNGAEEVLTPVLDSGTPPWPTGEFLNERSGTPYHVTGVASATTGLWDSITIRWKDQSTWTFTPATDGDYWLTSIGNRMARSIHLIRDPDYNWVTMVTDDSPVPVSLLSFTYDGDDHLSSIQDAYSRKVVYSFGPSSGYLSSVSQLAPVSAVNPPMKSSYEYQTVGYTPRLTSISFPSPTGSGLSTQAVTYNMSNYKVAAVEDANGNRHEYDYQFNNGTTIRIKNSQGVIGQQYTHNFDINRRNVSVGVTDSKLFSSAIGYSDSVNETRSTSITDKNGKETSFTYDKFGNVLSITDPRGTVTTYSYNYPDSEGLNDDYPDSQYPTDFRLGRLMKIQQGSITPTTFTYYEPSGLVHEITNPKPGTTDGSTVTTSFTYDALGNVLTKTTPGNNAASTITTTYNYTTDGTYSQPAKIGQPLTITDNLGHVTHFRYDQRGNVTSAKDALNHETNLTYNLADQPLAVIHPPTVGSP